jgi:hypothetical protein
MAGRLGLTMVCVWFVSQGFKSQMLGLQCDMRGGGTTSGKGLGH